MIGIDLPYSTLGHAHEIAASKTPSQPSQPSHQPSSPSFVIRYLSPDTRSFSQKHISSREASGLLASSLAVGFVWETLADISIFTPEIARSHAEQAVSALSSILADLKVSTPHNPHEPLPLYLPPDFDPSGVAIYFAVDFDATPEQVSGPISSYFSVVHDYLSTNPHDKFCTGAYGSAQTIRHLYNAHLISKRWLAQSPGWSPAIRSDMLSSSHDYEVNQLLPSSHVSLAPGTSLPCDFNVLNPSQSDLTLADAGFLTKPA